MAAIIPKALNTFISAASTVIRAGTTIAAAVVN